MEHQKDRKEKELCWLGSERFQNHQAISTIYSNTTIMEYTIDAQLKTTHASVVKRRNFAHTTFNLTAVDLYSSKSFLGCSKLITVINIYF